MSASQRHSRRTHRVGACNMRLHSAPALDRTADASAQLGSAVADEDVRGRGWAPALDRTADASPQLRSAVAAGGARRRAWAMMAEASFRRRAWAIVGAVVVLAGGPLTGCATTTRPAVAPATFAGPPTAPPLDPQALVWAIPSRPATLDPARMRDDPAAAQVGAQIYDRLVHFRPGTAELAPGLAETWTSNPDGRVFTFLLREGLRFHDGTPLDAAAVVWNFQRWMDPKHVAHKGEFRAWRDYFGGFVGETDGQGRAINLVAGVEALDRRTVRISLHAPFAPLPYHLAMVPFSIASPTAVLAQGEDYGSDGDHLPVGSGPFRAGSWSPEGVVVLTADAGHWAGPPAVPALCFVTVSDVARRLQVVAAGEVQGAEFGPTEVVSGTLVSGATFMPRPPRANAWLMLNQSREPLGDVRVRRAISLAIDRERLAREHFGMAALPSGQLLPPGFLGYEPTIRPAPFDPEQARRLLAEAGADSLKLNIWVANTPRGYLPDPLATAEALAEMLRQVGIQTAVKSENMRQFLMDRDRGRFTAWLTGWEAQSADPDSIWFWHFGAGRLAAEGQYHRSELAAALLRAQRSIQTAQREEIYRAAASTVAADEARVFLVYTRPLVLVSERVDNYLPSPMGFDSFRDVVRAPPSVGPVPGTLVLPLPETATLAVTTTVTATVTVTMTGTVTSTLKPAAGIGTSGPPTGQTTRPRAGAGTSGPPTGTGTSGPPGGTATGGPARTAPAGRPSATGR